MNTWNYNHHNQTGEKISMNVLNKYNLQYRLFLARFQTIINYTHKNKWKLDLIKQMHYKSQTIHAAVTMYAPLPTTWTHAHKQMPLCLWIQDPSS